MKDAAVEMEFIEQSCWRLGLARKRNAVRDELQKNRDKRKGEPTHCGDEWETPEVTEDRGFLNFERQHSVWQSKC